MNDQDVIRGKLGCFGRLSSRFHIIIIWDLWAQNHPYNFKHSQRCQYYYQQNSAMGNQGSSQNRGPIERRSRYRSIDNSALIYKSKGNSSRRNDDSFQDNSIFVTPPINRSFSSKRQVQQQPESVYEQQQPVADRSVRNYESLDVTEQRRKISSNGRSQRTESDRILLTLSRKNEELRKQLKIISDQLTEMLKRKKLVPKRKDAKQDDNESEVDNKQAEKQQMGLKRELENAYKQIEMYKKLLIELKSKQEGTSADHRVNILENDIAIKNEQIEKLQQKKQALQKIRNKQASHIKQQINQELINGIDTYKKQSQQLHLKLKKLAKQDRARQQAYKKQQAYLCDLQKKWRQLDDSYFPDISNKLKKEPQKAIVIDKDINEREFYQVAEEARLLRIKHEEYNRKIQQFLMAKNKRIEEQNDLKEQIVYKEKIIQTLKAKIANVNKLLKPRKKNLFGYDSQQQGSGSEVQSEYNDNASQIQRQLQEELNQDQFDIKHLIANIPKPIKKRPQELTNGYSSGGDSSADGGGGQQRKRIGGGMIITSQKAQPKRWGATTTRSQQRGKHFKGELAFEDKGQFESDVQPIIVGVNMWVNKNNTILGVQAIYLNNNELRYGAKSSESADGIIKRFDLQTPDYLKNLTFTISKDGFIQSLTLYSKQGKVGKFGNKRAEDENVNFGLASSERPFLFFGASSLFQSQPRLNSFGIQICSE